MNSTGKLGVGPMSSQIIEAVFRYSSSHQIPLMLIASLNQINYLSGYVNGWTTKKFIQHISLLRRKYPQAKVFICRDHCGPGFYSKLNTLKEIYRSIDSDLENGFNLLHIDFCHLSGGKDEILNQSQKAIEYIRKNSPRTLIEIGTDENTGAQLTDAKKIEQEMKYFTSRGKIHFFVSQTGSLIKEMNQIGRFNPKFIRKVKPIADKFGVKLKEHNADYLQGQDIKLRKGLISAVNVAPQFGLLQTSLALQKSLTYGVDASDFLNAAYSSGKWKKWLHTNTHHNKLLCSLVAGHYVFSGVAYRRLHTKINLHENFDETIINETVKTIDLYIKNL